MRGKQLGNMRRNKRGQFAEIQEMEAQQRGDNYRRDPDMRHLAQPARRIVLSVGVGVRRYLQKEEQRNQRHRNGHGHGQPSALPGLSAL